MNTNAQKRQLLVRILMLGDHYEWEIFAPDGTPIEGWHMASIGRDQAGRNVLHVTFDQFQCIDSQGKHIDIDIAGMPVESVSNEKPLPSPRHHGIVRH